MWKPGIIRLSVLFSLIVALAGVPVAASEPSQDTHMLSNQPAPHGVTLLSSTEQGVSFEVTLPWTQLAVDPVSADGSDHVAVSVPDWGLTGQQGAPALPYWVETIGVPHDARVSIQVTPGASHVEVLAAPVLPAATAQTVWDTREPVQGMAALPRLEYAVIADAALYGGGVYPGALAEIVNDGVLREQRVIGVAAYPVQYDPLGGSLTIYHSLRVDIMFEREPEAGAQLLPSSPDAPVMESVLQQQVLNYESARAWRQPAPLIADQAAIDGPAAQGAAGQSLPWTPPSPGWRINVSDDGMYRITRAELAAAGFPVSTVDPRTLQLFYLGAEVAIMVVGEQDGVFDMSDYVVFCGQAVQSKYTDANVYWLTYGQASGLRMASRSGSPAGGTESSSYLLREHLEENHWYLPGAVGDDDLDRWMWDYVYPPSRPSRSYSFDLAAPPDGPGTATFTARLQGRISLQAYDPDHHARFLLNGVQVADVTWDGLAAYTVHAAFPQSLLVPGSNTLELVAPNDLGPGYDVIYLDWFAFEFPAAYVARGDALPFGQSAGTWIYTVEGFSVSAVEAYDVTNPWAVSRIDGLSVSPSGGGYAARFQDVVAAHSDYAVVAGAGWRSVTSIQADVPSTLTSLANGADHLIITHAELAGQAERLRSFRASQGLRAVLVNVQDIYDEFGYGLAGAQPIRAFLAYAYAHWQRPAPTYVLLVGDGHFDPRDYGGHGRISHIPPYLAVADPWLGETAADNRYVTVAGNDTLPDMMLGRLAVNSVAEAQAFVDKIIAYPQALPDQTWQQRVLAVADRPDASAGNFAAFSDAIVGDIIPRSYAVTRVNYGTVPHATASQARTAVLAGINAGTLLVNYIGHASSTRWGTEDLLRASDVSTLTNGARMPVLLPMTCFEGYFIMPHLPADNQDSLAEVVTRASNKGAIASWSPTGMGVATGHDYLDRAFLKTVFQDADGQVSLGQATVAGRFALWSTAGHLDLIDTYTLFGDPATTLSVTPFVDYPHSLWLPIVAR